MGEDSVDTSSLDDVSTDSTDTSSFFAPIDADGTMDDIPAEPIEGVDVESIDSGLEAEIPTVEAVDINSLMDDAADTYAAEDVTSGALDSSGLAPSDVSSGIDDYEMDAGSEIADLMDEAAMEALEDTAIDMNDMSQNSDDSLESLMNEVDIAPGPGEEALDAKPEDANESIAAEVESLMDAEDKNPSDSSDTLEALDNDLDEASPETPDISALMDENDVDDSTTPTGENQEGLLDAFEVSAESPDDLSGVDNIPSEEVAENSDEFTQMTEERTRENFATPNAENGEYAEQGLSALDRMGEYYSSHNYWQGDFQEYSKDPLWQELNNDLLREMGREPIDYSNADIPNAEDIREMFVAAGVPEGSPELEAIMSNEQGGMDAIVEEERQESSSPVDPLDDGASAPSIEPSNYPTESFTDADVSSGPIHLPQNDVETFIDHTSDKDALQDLRERLRSGEIKIDDEGVSEEIPSAAQDIPQELPRETPSATDLPDEINYDEVFEGLDTYDFDGINYASNTERLDSSLNDFDSNIWEGLTLDEQKAAMTDLADYVKDVIGFDNPPEIVYYNNPVDGDYGGYLPESNTLEVNEYMLYNNEEAADTVAHELWHAYQHQRASNPQSAKDYQYRYGFDNYIRPEDDFSGYQDQLVEAEARAFAQQFKDRLNMKRRRV